MALRDRRGVLLPGAAQSSRNLNGAKLLRTRHARHLAMPRLRSRSREAVPLTSFASCASPGHRPRRAGRRSAAPPCSRATQTPAPCRWITRWAPGSPPHSPCSASLLKCACRHRPDRDAGTIDVEVPRELQGRLNEVLSEGGFDRFCEALPAQHYAGRVGRRSLPPGGCTSSASACADPEVRPAERVAASVRSSGVRTRSGTLAARGSLVRIPWLWVSATRVALSPSKPLLCPSLPPSPEVRGSIRHMPKY